MYHECPRQGKCPPRAALLDGGKSAAATWGGVKSSHAPGPSAAPAGDSHQQPVRDRRKPATIRRWPLRLGPTAEAIVFWYVDAEGGLTTGTVQMEEGKLVHAFEEITADGKSAAYVAKVTPHGEASWENEIFARRGNDLTPIVKVRYEIAASGE